MVPHEQWSPEMLDWREPHGPLISRTAAAYPGPMNAALAESWVRGAVSIRIAAGQASSLVVTGLWSNVLVRRDLLKTRLEAITNARRTITDDLHSFYGTPKVVKRTPLRPGLSREVPTLQDANCCVCGLVDTW